MEDSEVQVFQAGMSKVNPHRFNRERANDTLFFFLKNIYNNTHGITSFLLKHKNSSYQCIYFISIVKDLKKYTKISNGMYSSGEVRLKG